MKDDNPAGPDWLPRRMGRATRNKSGTLHKATKHRSKTGGYFVQVMQRKCKMVIFNQLFVDCCCELSSLMLGVDLFFKEMKFLS